MLSIACAKDSVELFLKKLKVLLPGALSEWVLLSIISQYTPSIYQVLQASILSGPLPIAIMPVQWVKLIGRLFWYSIVWRSLHSKLYVLSMQHFAVHTNTCWRTDRHAWKLTYVVSAQICSLCCSFCQRSLRPLTHTHTHNRGRFVAVSPAVHPRSSARIGRSWWLWWFTVVFQRDILLWIA